MSYKCIAFMRLAEREVAMGSQGSSIRTRFSSGFLGNGCLRIQKNPKTYSLNPLLKACALFVLGQVIDSKGFPGAFIDGAETPIETQML